MCVISEISRGGGVSFSGSQSPSRSREGGISVYDMKF